MIEQVLPFPEIREAKFVHGIAADRPDMTQVPLLDAAGVEIAETRDVRAGCLKEGKGLELRAIVEVVVSAELLATTDFVVYPNGELVAAVSPHWDRLDRATATWVLWRHELVEEVRRDRVKTSRRDLVFLRRDSIRKDTWMCAGDVRKCRVGRASCGGRSALRRDGRSTTCPVL